MQEALHKAQDTDEEVRDILPLSYHGAKFRCDGAFNESTIGLVMISTKNPHFSAGVQHE